VLGELVLMRLMPENRSESGFRLPALLEFARWGWLLKHAKLPENYDELLLNEYF